MPRAGGAHEQGGRGPAGHLAVWRAERDVPHQYGRHRLVATATTLILGLDLAL